MGGYTAVFRHAGSARYSSVYLLKNRNSTLVFTLRDSFSDLVIGSGGDAHGPLFRQWRTRLGQPDHGRRRGERLRGRNRSQNRDRRGRDHVHKFRQDAVSNTRILSGGYQYLQWGAERNRKSPSGGMFMAGSGAAVTGVDLENGAIWGTGLEHADRRNGQWFGLFL
ncbi:MAG: hypothetical protein V8T86_01915 [Victivallis sp.]